MNKLFGLVLSAQIRLFGDSVISTWIEFELHSLELLNRRKRNGLADKIAPMGMNDGDFQKEARPAVKNAAISPPTNDS
jgi:hypothetical protein